MSLVTDFQLLRQFVSFFQTSFNRNEDFLLVKDVSHKGQHALAILCVVRAVGVTNP